MTNESVRCYTYYRPAILLLLEQSPCHGYLLSHRLVELGFEQRLASSLYSVLRTMEEASLIASTWEMSLEGGPPKRVYATTEVGRDFLSEVMPLVTLQRQALDNLIQLWERTHGHG